MKYLFTYDFTASPDGDRRRAKMARLMLGLGLRVQYSVFEAEMIPEHLPRVIDSIRQIIDDNEDSVRIYSLCRQCTGRSLRLGKEAVFEHDEVLFW